jgi:hypothetical protein
VVIAVDHPGNNAREAMTPAAAILPWTAPRICAQLSRRPKTTLRSDRIWIICALVPLALARLFHDFLVQLT